MAMSSFQPAAGPSRLYAPPVPSKSPSPSSSPVGDSGSAPWTNGYGQTSMPEPSVGRVREEGESSRRNPLVDLIESENVYVEELGLLVRRVAGAWSRKDMPPPKLDTMFRLVEAIYRANKAFGLKLSQIGPNPSSPKALGDLLMRWIDDLEPAYLKYARGFFTGFDSYPPLTRNELLGKILTDITAEAPPTPPLTRWSVDALFVLPYSRLRYYRKLYARLLRSTKEGRSDHRLLVVANQRLEAITAELEGRLDMDIGEVESLSPSEYNGERSREPSWQERISTTSVDSSLDSHSNFSPFSSRVEDPRNSGGSAATSLNQSPQKRPPTTSGPAPLSDLELRIDTERTLDLFTMMPKKCKLSMNPPNLPFTRFSRSSHDVTVHFTPNSTGQAVVHHRAHVFILADLFLMAEWMEVSEKAAKAHQVAREQPERMGLGGPMPEMWLSYPPLAGKHLTVSEGPQPNVLVVSIMRKETFVIHAESDMARDQMMKDIMECIDFAQSASRRNTSTPSLDPLSPMSDNRGDGSFPPLRYPSPFSPASSPSASPRPSDTPEMSSPPPTMNGNALVSQMSKMTLQPGETMQWNRGPSPPPPPPHQSFGPPEVGVLPPRGASLRTKPAPTQTPLQIPQLPQFPFAHSNSADSGLVGASVPRSPSGRSVQSAPRSIREHDIPPVPQIRGPGSHLSEGSAGSYHTAPHRSRSAEPLRLSPGPLEPPSARFSSFPTRGPLDEENDSPPGSPSEEDVSTLTGPAIISAQMKCKIFLKQSHQQWKSLGAGKLKLYAQKTGATKQLVVESDSSSKAMLISTIVLTDGVERVAKTGVAVEISDKGKRTGIVYMIQLRNENSAAGLFESLLAGSDRAVGR